MRQPTSRQIPLNLPVDEALDREDLIESPSNATALSMIDAWPDWPGQITLLVGPLGSGKTHLGLIWVGLANAKLFLSADFFAEPDQAIQQVADGTNILLEDVCANEMDETSLFHLLNATRQGGGYCLITSRSHPADWGLSLPDLASRIKSAQQIEVLEPDDLLLGQVMVKLFADRQLLVEPRVINYCITRMERSLAAAAALVETIDREALASRSKITRAMASHALGMLKF